MNDNFENFLKENIKKAPLASQKEYEIILSKIEKTEDKKIIQLSRLLQRKEFWLSAAASLVLISGASFSVLNISSDDESILQILDQEMDFYQDDLDSDLDPASDNL